MAAAYLLSIIFTMIYGRAAAYNRGAEKVLMPLLDVLQSVPILSFLPVVLLGFSAIFPVGMAAELASVVLIFTSQAWNLTFAWYQSLTTVPKQLREASAIFRLNSWMRFKSLELPFATINLVWNSMMSWAGGWFFLMATEIFTVGQRDFRLPGLGAYLSQAAIVMGELGIVLWNNVETFTRDMPIKFPPIDFPGLREKLLISARHAKKNITFEFSHFMSPNSCSAAARNLSLRYREYIAGRTGR